MPHVTSSSAALLMNPDQSRAPLCHWKEDFTLLTQPWRPTRHAAADVFKDTALPLCKAEENLHCVEDYLSSRKHLCCWTIWIQHFMHFSKSQLDFISSAAWDGPVGPIFVGFRTRMWVCNSSRSEAAEFVRGSFCESEKSHNSTSEVIIP